MKYVITPGIAALIHVDCPLFPARQSYIYLSKDGGITKGCGDRVDFEELPPEVQHDIEKHFTTVFLLPVEDREQYLKATPPWIVEVSDA